MVKNEQFFTGTAAVKVVLRIRPTSDQDRIQSRCLVDSQDTVCIVPSNQLFIFDNVFGPTTPQCEIFSTIGKDLVPKFIEGNNVTVLAFGQASSGKTFTMGTAQQTGKFDESTDGIIPRAMMELFQVLQQQFYNNAPLFTRSSPTTSTVTPCTSKPTSSARSLLSKLPTPVTPIPSKSTGTSFRSSTPRYKVMVSFIEVHNEELTDLLNDAPHTQHPPLAIHEDTKGQIYWTGAKQVNVNNVDDALLYLKNGATSRATGATRNNDKSSRSHTIYSVTLQQVKWVPSPSSSLSQHQHQHQLKSEQPSNGQSCPGGQWATTTSKFHFVDLAGGISPRRTYTEEYRQKEGTSIENVMAALDNTSKHGAHIPYRDSMLSRLLKGSIGGDAVTVMIACVSPKKQDLSETLDTLHYAVCARDIKNPSRTNGAGIWKTSSNADTDAYQSEPPLLPTDDETPKFTPSPVETSSGSSDYNNITIERPNEPEKWQDGQQYIITELQQQIKKLDEKASASEEHNKLVAMELQHFKNLYQRSSGSQQLDLRFIYYVEPIIEEYEKSMGNLQVENSVLKAAVNYSNTTMDELQSKCDNLQQTVNRQENTIASLMESRQRIVTLLGEVKEALKLQQATRNRVFFDGLRNRATSWRQIELRTLNMDHILDDLQKSPHSTMQHTESSGTPLQQDTIGMDPHQQIKNSSAKDWSQEPESALLELDKLKEKCQQLEADRDRWKTQAERHSELDPKHLHQPAKPTTNSEAGSSQFRRTHNNYHAASGEQATTSITKPGDNERGDASCTALNTNTVDCQPSCASISKRQVEQLGSNYTRSINELDGVLQRYFDMLDYAERLEHISVMDTTQPSTSSNSVTNNVSLLLSLTCNPDTLTSTNGTGTISPADDRMSDWTVLSSSTSEF